MKKAQLMGVAAAVACAGVMATAQTTQPSEQREHAAMASDQPVTLVGCLEQKSATSSTAGQSTSEFVLTNATMKSVGSTSTSGSSGTSGYGATGSTGATGTAGSAGTTGSTGTTGSASSTPDLTKATYKIEGLSDSNLKDHVGHRVEVMGKVERGKDSSKAPGSMGSTGTSGSTDTTGGTGATGSAGSAGTMGQSHGSMGGTMMAIKATSIKHLSETCSSTGGER